MIVFPGTGSMEPFIVRVQVGHNQILELQRFNHKQKGT